MPRIFLFISLLFSVLSTYAQENIVYVYGYVKDDNTGLKMADVKVNLVQDGKALTSFSTPATGKFEMDLEFNHDYELHFVKQGYVEKYIKIDTRNVPKDNQVGGFGFDVDISLFATIEGVNFDLFKQPVGIAKYSAATGEINFDYDYTKAFLAKIEELKKSYLKKLKEEEDKLKAEQLAEEQAKQKKLKFEQLVKEGDQQMASTNFSNAIFKFTDALTLMPGTKFVEDKLAAAKKALDEQNLLKEKELRYKEAIAAADKSMLDKNFQKAITEYNAALNHKPSEQYPKNRIKDAENELNLLAQKAEQEKKYKSAISAGDSLMLKQQFSQAIKRFEEALSVKPAEAYPSQKILESKNKLDEIAKQKAIDERFALAMSNGDKSLNEKNLEASLTFFKEASGIKPDESLPKKKIVEVQALIDAAKKATELNQEYQNLIAKADADFKSEAYTPAVESYQKASALKPSEQYPKQKIAEAQKRLLEKQKSEELDRNYLAAINLGAKELSAANFTPALNAYTQASTLKPNERLPKEKIAEIKLKLAEIQKQEELDKNFAAALKKGDEAFTAKNFGIAISSYQEALALKPQDEVLKQKLATAIDAKSAKDADDKLNAQYKNLLTQADTLFKNAKWEQAVGIYQQASDLKPSEKYPIEKINAAKAKMAEIAEKNRVDQEYQNAVAEADGLFKQQKFKDAIASYKTAAFIKPNETYPPTKIKEAETKLADIAKKEEADKQYSDLIAKADVAYSASKWEEALAAYQLASSVKPQEQYPKDKILAVRNELNNIAKEKALNQQFNDLVSKADAAYQGKNLAEALKLYQQASGLKPTESYPKEQITKINAEQEQLAQKQKLENAYKAFIAKGDSLLAKNVLDAAENAYVSALDLKANEAYPQGKLNEIKAKRIAAEEARNKEEAFKNAMADGEANLVALKYPEAIASFSKALDLKNNDITATNKLKEAKAKLAEVLKNKALQARFDSTMASASAQYQNNELKAALNSFTFAQSLKPQEAEPGLKIAEIKQLLAKQADEENKLKKYNQVISQADSLFKANKWSESIVKYTDASGIKSEENYPKQQIQLAKEKLNEIQREKEEKDKAFAARMAEGNTELADKNAEGAIGAFQEALKINSASNEAKAKLAEANKLKSDLEAQAKIQAEYQQVIAQADALFSDDKFAEALPVYQKAAGLRANETYPKKRIEECNNALAQLKAEQASELKYTNLIAKADKEFQSMAYELAAKSYKEALAIKPDQSYPKDQLEICQIRIDELNAAKMKESNYKNALLKADSAFTLKNFDKAISLYEDALDLKPTEAYPKQKIEAAKNELAKIADIQKLEQLYKIQVTKADSLFRIQLWNDAIVSFEEALKLKPAETYPKQKISEAKLKIDELDKLRLAREQKYNTFINQADSAFNKQKYQVAKNYYAEAIRVNPKEQYPKDQMDLCDAKLDELAKLEADKAAKAELEKLNTPIVEEKDPTIVSFKDATSFQGAKKDTIKAVTKVEEPKPQGPKVSYRTSTDGDLDAFRRLLGSNYPEGKTVEEFVEGSKRIFRTIYVKDKLGDEYLKVVFNNGLGTFYFKNGDSSGLTSQEFDRQIKELK